MSCESNNDDNGIGRAVHWTFSLGMCVCVCVATHSTSTTVLSLFLGHHLHHICIRSPTCYVYYKIGHYIQFCLSFWTDQLCAIFDQFYHPFHHILTCPNLFFFVCFFEEKKVYFKTVYQTIQMASLTWNVEKYARLDPKNRRNKQIYEEDKSFFVRKI